MSQAQYDEEMQAAESRMDMATWYREGGYGDPINVAAERENAAWEATQPRCADCGQMQSMHNIETCAYQRHIRWLHETGATQADLDVATAARFGSGDDDDDLPY